MPNNNTDPLFQLIKSLTKAEKRYFKLHATIQKASEDAKFIKLFDLIDKQNDLHLFQKIIMKFLKKLGSITRDKLIDAFKELIEQLLPLNDKFYERRPFIYFDIISWLESKIDNRDVQEVIKEKTQKKIINNS